MCGHILGGGWGWAELRQEGEPETRQLAVQWSPFRYVMPHLEDNVRELGEKVGDPVVSCCKVGCPSHSHCGFGY